MLLDELLGWHLVQLLQRMCQGVRKVFMNFLLSLYFFHGLVVWELLVESIVLAVVREVLNFIIVLLERSRSSILTIILWLRLWGLPNILINDSIRGYGLLVRRHDVSSKVNFVSYTFLLVLLANFILRIHSRLCRFVFWVIAQLLRALNSRHMSFLLVHEQL